MRTTTTLALAAAFIVAFVSALDAAPTAEQRQQFFALRTPYKKAENLFRAGKYKECAEVVAEVQEKVEALAKRGDAEMIEMLQPLHKWLGKFQANVEFDLQGIKLPPLKDLPDPASPAKPPATEPANEMTFTTAVAPILVGKCGRCHVNQTRGEFSMSTFANLMRGTPAGSVIRKGDASGSRMIEVIESGDMPRGGGKLSADELATLKKWIDAGAPYDGDDPNAGLQSLARMAANPQMKVEVKEATGRETVSFSRDLAPVLAEKCVNCHGRGRPQADFNVSTFRGLLDGGDSGPPVAPGKPADSLLIQKLRGTAAGERMPRNQPPLPEDVIARFEKWIAEGARFDGPDAGQDVEQVAALYRAKNSTHEELSAERAQLAEQNWNLALPNIDSATVDTPNFHLRGNVGENTLAQIGQQAEAAAPQVAAIFGAPTDKPLIKGKMTLYVFPSRYDYTELGQMVERRSIPRTWHGHWVFNIVDAYGAVVQKGTLDDFSFETLIGQQLAGAYVASHGNSPRWFSEGAARAAATRLGKDSRTNAWDEQLSQILAKMSRPDDFMTGKLSPEEADVAAYRFVDFLMSDARKFRSVLRSLRGGADFEKAFVQAYGAAPAPLTGQWYAKTAKRRR